MHDNRRPQSYLDKPVNRDMWSVIPIRPVKHNAVLNTFYINYYFYKGAVTLWVCILSSSSPTDLWHIRHAILKNSPEIPTITTKNKQQYSLRKEGIIVSYVYVLRLERKENCLSLFNISFRKYFLQYWKYLKFLLSQIITVISGRLPAGNLFLKFFHKQLLV